MAASKPTNALANKLLALTNALADTLAAPWLMS